MSISNFVFFYIYLQDPLPLPTIPLPLKLLMPFVMTKFRRQSRLPAGGWGTCSQSTSPGRWGSSLQRAKRLKPNHRNRSLQSSKSRMQSEMVSTISIVLGFFFTSNVSFNLVILKQVILTAIGPDNSGSNLINKTTRLYLQTLNTQTNVISAHLLSRMMLQRTSHQNQSRRRVQDEK